MKKIGYNEIHASFGMSREIRPKFELLNSFHPEQNRHLTEDEENLFFPFLKYVNQIDSSEDGHIGFIEVAQQFGKYFPEIKKYSDAREFYHKSWEGILQEIEAIQLAYIFYPGDVDVQRKTRNEFDVFKAAFHDNLESHTKTNAEVSWTLSYSLLGFFGQRVEEKFGVTTEIKNKTSISKYPSGFISNYLTHSEKEMHELLSPRQFEELVAMFYENDGWNIQITKKTRDGGKDIIATKFDNGDKLTAFVEAKQPIKNKIGVGKVREFYAVIRDETDRGYFITTSEFTEDAREWLEQKKLIAPVFLELIDKNGVQEKLGKLVGNEGYKYIFK